MPDPGAGSLLLLRDRERLVAAWALWSVSVLVLAAGAMALPGPAGNPWTAAFGAPPLARWDSVWYREIAVEGYRFDPVTTENIGWYPLYPLAVRAIAAVFHTPVFATGIAFSLLCLLAALGMLAELFAAEAGRDVLPFALGALLLFPTAFFFASFYTESLFLATSVGAFWSIRSERWTRAGLFGLAAALTRFNGFLILVPIVWAVWRSLRGRWKSLRAGHVAALALPAVGAALFPAYLWWRWGDPFLYLRSKDLGNNKRATPLWELAGSVGRDGWARLRDPAAGGVLDWLTGFGATALFIGLTVLLFRRRRLDAALYCAALLLLLLHSGNLDGMPRFVLALFPCFLPLGELLRREVVLAFGYAFFSVGAGMILLHRFVHWIIVA